MSDQEEFSFLSEIEEETPHKKKLSFNVGRVLFTLLKEPKLKPPIEIKKEAGMLVNLVKKYPNEKFWSKIEFDFKVRSLAYFFTPEGDAEVNKLYCQYHYQSPSAPEAKETRKKGVDPDIIRQPKNIREWLQ